MQSDLSPRGAQQNAGTKAGVGNFPVYPHFYSHTKHNEEILWMHSIGVGWV